MSNFVLKWEIDNPNLIVHRRLAVSEIWRERGFEWNAIMIPSAHSRPLAIFFLVCSVSHKGPFDCEAEIKYNIRTANGCMDSTPRKMLFHEHNNIWKLESVIHWRDLSGPEYYVNGKVALEFRINILDSFGGEIRSAVQIGTVPNLASVNVAKFASPIESGNVSLLIGGKTLTVSKEFLAMHSPVFSKMFFGKFTENGKKEIELKEVDYEEFLHLLLVFFPEPCEISDATVAAIAKLADRFQITKFTTVEKIQLADNYRFSNLRDNCLQSFRIAEELKIFKKSPEFADFSDQMKAAICERMIEIL